MISRVLGQHCCSMTASSSELLPWSAATRPQAAPDGRCGWWRRKRSSASWCRRWDGKRSGYFSFTTTSSRGGKKMWCVAELDERYIAKMEDVLETYEQPYHPQEPVVCLDEKPVTLHAEVRPSSPAAPGREARRDNEYERRGTANIFCAVEPKAGRHFTFPTPNRSGSEFAQVMYQLANRYPKARTIHLVLDNLNIHCRKSLTDRYGEERGGEIWDRFTIHYTPTHGSWLNQAEIEIGLFARQCLGKRRIPDLATLRQESRAWNHRINRARTKIQWKFDRRAARRKFGYNRNLFKRSKDYFQQNAVEPDLPWNDHTPLSGAERWAVIRSIQQFQLGEGASGARLLRFAQHFGE